MAQQTAVEWLVNYMIENFHLTDESLSKFEQAKAMEKEQIVNADLNATIRTAKGINADVSVIRVKELAKQYYNETYSDVKKN
jgi:hypothetical protein